MPNGGKRVKLFPKKHSYQSQNQCQSEWHLLYLLQLPVSPSASHGWSMQRHNYQCQVCWSHQCAYRSLMQGQQPPLWICVGRCWPHLGSPGLPPDKQSQFVGPLVHFQFPHRSSAGHWVIWVKGGERILLPVAVCTCLDPASLELSYSVAIFTPAVDHTLHRTIVKGKTITILLLFARH